MRRTSALLLALSVVLAAFAVLGGSASAREGAVVPKAVNGPAVSRFLRVAVEQLPVQAEVRTGYERSKFKLWDDVDHDCRSTRAEVLAQESRRRVTGRCTVRTGSWLSQYDGAERSRASALDIDHLVPLAEAWDSGARSWDARKREAYANDLTDPRTLLAVTASTNRSKGDRDPAEWMPAQRPCKYLAQWVVVKTRWRLAVDPAEKSTLRALAAVCPNWRISTHYARVALTGKKASGSTHPHSGGSGSGGGGGGQTGGGCTPGYSPCLPPASDYDCAGGSGNGPAYADGPVYVTGSDPYDLDSDGNGVACE